MTRILFLFLDGIGLGTNDPAINPLARARMPHLRSLLNGHPLIASATPFEGKWASLAALDAGLGVSGLPQSATGQAVLLTGVNIPAELGYHDGPKPNPAVGRYLTDGQTLFSWLHAKGRAAALLNAYPPRYFASIASGKRMYSAIPLAVVSAGYPLFTQEDLYAGRALSADFTGLGWRTMLGLTEAPLLSAQEAGKRLGSLAQGYEFSLFEYWASDYAGHKQDMEWAVRQLEALDDVLNGLLSVWDMDADLILMTSDHGNMEDLSTRRHTNARVPALVIGHQHLQFSKGLKSLTDIAPRIHGWLERCEPEDESR
ncbi:MAG: metalloenzyme [Anaerolineales bacterium]